MRVKYVLREDTAYGVTALDKNGKVLANVPAILLDKEKMKNFVELCNSEKVELVHLADVIEDLKYE